MPMWVRGGRTAGVKIPIAVLARTERRILDHAARHHAGKFSRIAVRFHGAFCYIDAYVEPELEGRQNTPLHLCRIRYCGREDCWSFAWYTYAHEKYERSFLLSGQPIGTPEEAFDTSSLFY